MTTRQQASLEGPLADMDVATDLLDVCLGCTVVLAVLSGGLYVVVRWIWPVFSTLHTAGLRLAAFLRLRQPDP